MKDPVKRKNDLETKHFRLSDDIRKIKPPPQQTDYLVVSIFDRMQYKNPDTDMGRVLKQYLAYG